jgi:phage terminase large subunit-like protein
VAKWERQQIGALETTEPAPVIQIDALRYWIPKKDKEVDFTDVREYILSLVHRGFNIRLVTFDQWESADMRKYLESAGLRTDKLSVALKHYTDFAVAVSQGRLVGPDDKLLREELLALRIMPNGKIDHNRQGYKDLSDAVCGAIYNCIEHTPRDIHQIVEVKTLSQVRKEVRNDTVAKEIAAKGVIKAPKGSNMPKDIADWLGGLKFL